MSNDDIEHFFNKHNHPLGLKIKLKKIISELNNGID